MRIRENLGGLLVATSKKTQIPVIKPQMGKVFGVITTENTPTKELFDNNGGWKSIGTIFYQDYSQYKNIDTTDLTKCKIAKPLHASNQNYPLVGEIVQLVDSVAPTSQVSNTSIQKYYTNVINLWNSGQQNAPSGDSLGKTFSENADVRNLISFEGDRIYQGRKGNGIRFGSTVKSHSDINEWSNIGNDGDPITILVNGYVTTNKKSLTPNIEEIDKEMSSIYMTSTQQIILTPDIITTLNPLTQPKFPNIYKNGSQIILNSDRVTLNSKKDEVMIFAKTNIELSTNNIINHNAGRRVHLNSPIIWLGTKPDNTQPTEPLLLGNKTTELLRQLISILSTLGTDLTSVVTPLPGAPLVGVNAAGTKLAASLSTLRDLLKDITSKNNFTI